ncbi:exodeoxyribonuclease III [Sphingorhabdus buctiana]|jgi:exodeoxyribonuclease-3|uniref:Exodeoxyribonuclease III n=1 Tax=Sphingorhabdus buctiana TaxID=1508805 RepID=A0ABW4MA17_9SPHN
MATTLRIASWNINSVRARIDIVERFLREEAPDILCLQETKVADPLFPEGPFRQLGYNHIVINGQPMHHGVAILSKVPLANRQAHDWQANGEARHVGVELRGGVRLENVYVPAGGDIPDRNENVKFGQKLDFLARMTEWSGSLSAPTILTGDFNVAPLETDVWSHKQLLNVVSHTPIEVEALGGLQAAGKWVDLAREFVPPQEKLYTWWSYRAQDWETSDRGRRLDHMWVTPDLKDKAVGHKTHKPCRGWGKPSDHVPIVTEFRI